jgi:hypothetical protein
MSAATLPADLEGYKAASRASLEVVIERFAKIEQAINLQAGSMVEGLLEHLAEGSVEDVVSYISAAYELKEVPADWETIVEGIIDAEL